MKQVNKLKWSSKVNQTHIEDNSEFLWKENFFEKNPEMRLLILTLFFVFVFGK